MEINLLVLNVGNSRIATGAFVSGELAKVVRMPVDNRSDWERQIAETWEKIAGRENAAIVGASVNPLVIEGLEAVVQKVSGKQIVWVGKQIELPIKVKTDSPAETGVDRVLNIAAAYEQMEKACVVVDAGSAITIDLCNDAGEFLGGAIAPGAKMMLDAMHEKTAKLPAVQLEKVSGAIGTNTAQAMLHGVYNGIRGMVREIVENYATELGTWPDVIVTGGDAKILFDGWELVHAISPDLTLYGIALAYAENDEAQAEGGTVE